MPRVSRRANPTRLLILNEVERLIARKGVFGFTLQDVAGPLCVRVPAIYKHFNGRDDVLVELSRRLIDGLARQFGLPSRADADPVTTLKRRLNEFVDFHLLNPAYVRLSLVDFATPEGGMEYLTLASGGPLHETPHVGPLAAMHLNLAQLLESGRRAGRFRKVSALDFYLIVKSVLLVRLAFRNDTWLKGKPSAARIAETRSALWDVAHRYLALKADTPTDRAPRAAAVRSRGQHASP